VVNKSTGAGLRQIVVAIVNLDKELRVTEHINLEWLAQAPEHDVFSWLQTCFRGKEKYIYHDEKFVLLLSYEKLTPGKKAKLEQLKQSFQL
jgi:hypothetical protein